MIENHLSPWPCRGPAVTNASPPPAGARRPLRAGRSWPRAWSRLFTPAAVLAVCVLRAGMSSSFAAEEKKMDAADSLDDFPIVGQPMRWQHAIFRVPMGWKLSSDPHGAAA